MTINNWPPLSSLLTQKYVRAQLRALGISFKSLPESGEFKVGGTYFTDDLSDAYTTGQLMAGQRAASKSPIS